MAISIVQALEARRITLKMSRQELADKVHKDASTVAKQFSGGGSNMQLATLIEYANALDGAIVFQTAAEMADYNESAVAEMRQRILEMEQQRNALVAQVNALQEELSAKTQRIEKLKERIKDGREVIARKDDLIDRLVNRLLRVTDHGDGV